MQINMRHSLLATILFLMAGAVWAGVAGKVTLVDGEASVAVGRQAAKALAVGDVINEGDRLRTAAGAEVHVELEDGGIIALRPGSQLVMERFKAQGKPSDGVVMKLLVGGLRSVTGWIGKFVPGNYAIRTPNATIGIRGTDHETHVLPAGSKQGGEGTYDKVNVGGTSLQTSAGTVDLNPGQAGHAAPGRAPVLLKEVPAFFQPGAHDRRFESQRLSLQQLDQLRQERRAGGVGGSSAADSGRPGGAQGRSLAGASTRIKGNTQINAASQNNTAVAAGVGNQAGNETGVIKAER